MRLIGHLITYCTSAVVIALVLVACESPQQSSRPPATPPSSSPPPSSPTSQPSQPSTKQSPPSSPTSQPSQPSEPATKQSPRSSQPPSATPTAQQAGESSPPRNEQPQKSNEQARQQAAQTLKKAGEQVSKTAQRLPGPLGREWDPLAPDSQNQSQTNSETYEDSESSAPSSQEVSSPEPTGPIEIDQIALENGAPAKDDKLIEDKLLAKSGNNTQNDNEPSAQVDSELPPTESGTLGSEYPADLAGDMQAAQVALEQAGIAIQTAGAALETAETDTELVEAEKSLTSARISVILAGQDLTDIQDIFEGTLQEGNILDAEDALNEANAAIVIATDTIFDARIQLPDFAQPKANPATEPGQTGDQGEGDEQTSYPGARSGNTGSELDKALDDSIAIFEGRILDARNEALGSTPPPTSAENVPGPVVLNRSGLEQGSDTFEENSDERLDPGLPEVAERGRMPEGDERTKATIDGATPPVPEDIPSPQGDDIVAQQLREAAAVETDPNLRAKLWDEYKKYKAGL
jgi:hypothetical protein